jgi:hypothetical protein
MLLRHNEKLNFFFYEREAANGIKFSTPSLSKQGFSPSAYAWRF